jgi:hypothetical protein
MSILPLELRNTADGADALAEIERALRAARRRVARGRTFSVAASTLWIPIAAAAVWVIILRFTLLDLPAWPVLLFPAVWLVAMLVVSSSNQVTSGQCARYLDRTLGLDERVTTLLELARSMPLRNLSASSRPVPHGLVQDTAYQIRAKRSNLPGPWSFGMQRWQGMAIGAALGLLALGILVPTPLDAVRAERAALQQRVTTELNQIAQLRAEVVARPGLDAGDRQSIVAQLDKLQASLGASGLDRDGMLAALSDAQQQLQQLSPSTSSDFANIIAAARTMQQVMLDAVQNRARSGSTIDVTWSPSDFPGLSDLGLAANAADTLASQSNFLGSGLTHNTVSLLSRASNQAGSDDADLAGHLLDASTAVSGKDVEKAKAALQQTAQAFRNDDRRWQLAQSVDKIMSNLDDGRQSLAQVGADNAKKQQVGFRRPGAPSQNAVQVPGSTPTGNGGTGSQGSQNDQNASGVTSNSPSALGPQIAGGSAAYSSYKGNPASGSGGGPAGSQGGSQSGGGASQPGGGGAAQPGGGSASSGSGGQGTFTGPISGPVGGGAGAISQVSNPAGQGVSDGSQAQSTNPQSDSIYVPPANPTSAPAASTSGAPGSAAPEEPNAIAGRSSGSGDGPTTPSNLGQGSRSQIRTPYKQVIGDYVQQATQSLGSVYVPSDAKEYVKDYFSELGK